MINDSELYALSARLGAALKRDNKFITCAESCTGGWVAKTITDVSGSAGWFERGFVTYTAIRRKPICSVCAPEPWNSTAR